MTATYTIEFRQHLGGGWLDADGEFAYPEAIETGGSMARQWSGVRVSDGYMIMYQWNADGTPAPIRYETGGCPDNCTCGECELRKKHLNRSHEDKMCEHRTCRRCGYCQTCELAERRADLVRRRGKLLADSSADISSMSATVRKIRGRLNRFEPDDFDACGVPGVYDLEDAFTRIDQIQREFRDLGRILEVFQLRSQIEAAEEREKTAG